MCHIFFLSIRNQYIFLQVSTCAFTDSHTPKEKCVCVSAKATEDFLAVAGGQMHDRYIVCSFVLSHTSSLLVSVHIQNTHVDPDVHKHTHTLPAVNILRQRFNTCHYTI